MQGDIKEVEKIQDAGGLSQMPGGDFLEESRKSRIQNIKRIQESRISWMKWARKSRISWMPRAIQGIQKIQKVQHFVDTS